MITNFNHRVVAIPSPAGGQILAVCEVYYDEAGQPFDYNEPMAVDSESVAGLQQLLQSMAQAMELPVLHASEFEDDAVVLVELVVIAGGLSAAG